MSRGGRFLLSPIFLFLAVLILALISRFSDLEVEISCPTHLSRDFPSPMTDLSLS